MKMRSTCLLAAALALNTIGPTGSASAQTSTPGYPLSWITLGTQGGPIPNAKRSQPANLLVVAGKPWLVDCGDGALERLAAAGYEPSQVNTAFISHLHLDHIGGLQGLIGIRWFKPGKHSLLTIYGPPGTDAVVAGILQSLKPSARIEAGAGPKGATPETLTKVVIVKDGSDLSVDGVRIRAVRNAHFDTSPGQAADDGSQSLAHRFDYQGYGIGYTGDTGPSDAVTRLAKGVNLLVSEVIDLQAWIATTNASPMSPAEKQAVIGHFKTQHLTPQEAGKVAAGAGAGRLVFTHLSIVGTVEATAPNLIKQAHESFKGAVFVAHDLDKF
ncbi:MAG: MBL fold metallo-hydrolase [Bacteroidetes bacterium]|nr:MBL fold metallo-hydrolase [Fibrella sp.]